MEAPTDSFSWDVELPERRGSQLSWPRPRATLTIDSTHHGLERVSIPLSVGKALKSKLDSEELTPASRAELLYAVREMSAQHASMRIERLVDKRDYSAQEMDDKLRMDGYSSSVREAAIARAVDANIINDSRYASIFIRTKLSSGWGSMRIERELRRRGIDIHDVDGWPHEFLGEEDEFERALAVASSRRISPKNGFQKLVRFLCGRGFTLDTSMRVARQVIDEND